MEILFLWFVEETQSGEATWPPSASLSVRGSAWGLCVAAVSLITGQLSSQDIQAWEEQVSGEGTAHFFFLLL